MNMHKKKILERSSIYAEFKKTRDIGLERLKDVIIRLSEVVPDAGVSIGDSSDNSLHFKIFDFSVYVRFLIKVTKDIGVVQWYHILFEPKEQKDRAALVLEYYFDHLGNIYRNSSDKTTTYSFQTEFWQFTYQNILEFCEIADRGDHLKAAH